MIKFFWLLGCLQRSWAQPGRKKISLKDNKIFIKSCLWNLLLKSWTLFSQYSKEGFFDRIYFCDWFIPEQSAEFIFAIGCCEKTLTGFSFLIGSWQKYFVVFSLAILVQSRKNIYRKNISPTKVFSLKV